MEMDNGEESPAPNNINKIFESTMLTSNLTTDDTSRKTKTIDVSNEILLNDIDEKNSEFHNQNSQRDRNKFNEKSDKNGTIQINNNIDKNEDLKHDPRKKALNENKKNETESADEDKVESPRKENDKKRKREEDNSIVEEEWDIRATEDAIEEEEDSVGKDEINNVTAKGKFRTQLPPFIVKNSKLKTIAEILTKVIVLQNFIFKNLSENKLALYVNSYKDFRTVFDTLRNNKIEFHTKAPNEEKVYTWLLKGIAEWFEGEDIENELNQLKLKKVKILSIKKLI